VDETFLPAAKGALAIRAKRRWSAESALTLQRFNDLTAAELFVIRENYLNNGTPSL
jgi:hypothetical protein